MQTSDENKEKILIMGLLIDPILISPNKHNWESFDRQWGELIIRSWILKGSNGAFHFIF